MAEKRSRSPEQDSDGATSTRQSVVGIGASAGGLQALKRFFAAVPADSGLAYVVVVHLASDRESHLADLLQPHAQIPVTQVTTTTALAPNHVFVVPPGRNLSAVDSHLRLAPLEENRRDRAPVDHFFRTLADSYDGRSVAVVLTGTGSDGAMGVRRIRERGGIVLVQDPEEAEFDGMPRSAINTGAVDLVLPLEQMPQRILSLDRAQPNIRPNEDGSRPVGAEHDELTRILTQVRIRSGQDFSRYKRSTIERRVERRMQLQGVDQLSGYLDLLRDRPQEAGALADDLLINVTSFFRDPSVFRHVERDVIPRLFAEKGPSNLIRVWSVGCATGEEAYSLGMLLLEEAGRRERTPRIQIFASDLHERSLRQARDGLYPETIVADVSQERVERFFQPEGGGYRVRKELRELVVFAPHNLLRDPPFSHLDLVACRNVLIYLQREVQDEVIDLFHYALHGEGYLLLGTAETLDHSELFRLDSKENHLYRRRTVGRAELRLPNLPLASVASFAMSAGAGVPRMEPTGSYGALHQKLVERYAPPSVLVNAEHNVLHLSEHAGRYFQLPGGGPSSNVFKLVREELRLELRAVLHLAHERQTPSRSKPIAVRIDGEMRNVVLRGSPAGGQDAEGLMLVIFDELGVVPAPEESESHRNDDIATRELEADLEVTRNRLQALVEEFETSQEEMRASNEELQSANEELRSTMEELETSREELQSINEELQTLNQENRHKVDELSQLSSDLQNLLRVTDVATVFLDRGLRILRFTPRVGELFNIRHTDRGRPLADLTHRLGYGGLLDDARRVLETLVPVEREVATDDAHWYLIRVLPYRTVEERIDGVVITLVDVTSLKRTEAALRDREARLEVALEAGELGTWELDLATDQSISRSPRHDQVFGYTELQPEWGQAIAERHVVPEDLDEFRAAFARARQTGTLECEVRVRWPDGSVHWIVLRGRAYHDSTGSAVRMAGVIGDATVRKEADALAERAQREANRDDLRRALAAAEEAERRRLARELHDQLGQQLTAFRIGLEDLERLAASDGAQRAVLDRLSQLQKLTSQMTVGARNLAMELRPPELDDMGLESALETYVAEWAARYGVAAELAVTGAAASLAVPADVGSVVYRIVQEALTNIAKHASATEVSVIVDKPNGEVRLIVEDNGRGFDVDVTRQHARRTRRLGLAGMQERAALVGGTLKVESTPGGGGTAIYVRLPVDGTTDDAMPFESSRKSGSLALPNA